MNKIFKCDNKEQFILTQKQLFSKGYYWTYSGQSVFNGNADNLYPEFIEVEPDSGRMVFNSKLKHLKFRRLNKLKRILNI